MGFSWSHSPGGHKDFTKSDTVQSLWDSSSMSNTNCQVHLGCIFVDHSNSLSSTYILCAQGRVCGMKEVLSIGRSLSLKKMQLERKTSCT